VKDSRFQILLVLALLSLLGLLGFLQYKWLGQISEAEKEHLEKRLKTDSEKFAQDFNKEVSDITVNLRVNKESVENKDWSEFAEGFKNWLSQTKYPKLIKEIYIFQKDANPYRFDLEKQIFSEIPLTPDVQEKFGTAGNLKEEKFRIISAIVDMPSRKVVENDKQIIINHLQINAESPTKLDNIGSLIIQLDEETIKNQLLKNLNDNYFSDGEYEVSIIDKKSNELIFANTDDSQIAEKTVDTSVSLFETMPQNMAVFVRNTVSPNLQNQKTIEKRTESKTVSVFQSTDSVIRMSKVGNKMPDILQGNKEPSGRWLLNLHHKDGSLEEFVDNTRRKNLAISFGILSLLAVSIGLIFVSTNRAKRLAQRQIDFVSSVSHEFRTPISVIYSAGENLSDGVIDSSEKVTNYGNLIKGEGKKLSAMVEQILEFAGANSGKKKYKFEDVEVSQVVENAILECQSLLEKDGFTLEKNLDENLPHIHADANALSHAIQNLITNSIKYSNGEKYLKISTKNGNRQVKIEVEDKGIGIDKKDLRQIFEPFYRAKDVVDAQIHGNGLGLSLVKQIITAHNGQIEVESELGKGSKFIIILPN
jgi:signal transduction histidine kinase